MQEKFVELWELAHFLVSPLRAPNAALLYEGCRPFLLTNQNMPAHSNNPCTRTRTHTVATCGSTPMAHGKQTNSGASHSGTTACGFAVAASHHCQTRLLQQPLPLVLPQSTVVPLCRHHVATGNANQHTQHAQHTQCVLIRHTC